MTAVTVGVFIVTYVLIAARRLTVLPIGRPAGALLGAVLMVVAGSITPAEAHRAVDADTIVLLFAMMTLSAYLETSGLFARGAGLTLRICRTPRVLLVALAIVPGVLAAFLVNDAVCLFLAPIVVSLCLAARLPMGPFLLALATSANIGSSATLVGNPQNMIVGSLSHVGFVWFMGKAGPAAIAGLAVNAALLLAYFARALPPAFPANAEIAPRPDARWPVLTGVVTVGVVVGFLAGHHLGWTTMAGVMVLVIADRAEPRRALERVDWSLLVFFACLFIVVAALGKTGLPDEAWRAAGPWMGLREPTGIAAFSALLAIGSNLFSNVPMVLLTGPHLHELGDPDRGWVLLAFVTTIAGNLTLIGSVANIIVAEQAKQHYTLGFWEYLRFGAVSTVVVLAIGVPLVCAMT